MNVPRHLRSHMQLYRDLVNGDAASAAVTKAFYDEYFAVLDMPAEFYLETVEAVFQEFALARSSSASTAARSTRRPSGAPRCSPSRASATTSARSGQTLAAHDLCSGSPPVPEAPPPAARRRALRRVQRPSLGDAGVPARAGDHPGQRLTDARPRAPHLLRAPAAVDVPRGAAHLGRRIRAEEHGERADVGGGHELP